MAVLVRSTALLAGVLEESLHQRAVEMTQPIDGLSQLNGVFITDSTQVNDLIAKARGLQLWRARSPRHTPRMAD